MRRVIISSQKNSAADKNQKVYLVSWLETNRSSCTVTARTAAEAVEIVKNGDHLGISDDIGTDWNGDPIANSIEAKLATRKDIERIRGNHA